MSHSSLIIDDILQEFRTPVLWHDLITLATLGGGAGAVPRTVDSVQATAGQVDGLKCRHLRQPACAARRPASVCRRRISWPALVARSPHFDKIGTVIRIRQVRSTLQFIPVARRCLMDRSCRTSPSARSACYRPASCSSAVHVLNDFQFRHAQTTSGSDDDCSGNHPPLLLAATEPPTENQAKTLDHLVAQTATVTSAGMMDAADSCTRCRSSPARKSLKRSTAVSCQRNLAKSGVFCEEPGPTGRNHVPLSTSGLEQAVQRASCSGHDRRFIWRRPCQR